MKNIAICRRDAAYTGVSLHGYRLRTVKDGERLEEVVMGLEADNLLFVGSWGEITVGVQRILARWAAEKGSRGCGLVITEDYSEHTKSSQRQASAGGSCGPTVLLNPLSCFTVEEGVVKQHVAERTPSWGASDVGPHALGITGHGAETCIQVGKAWVTTCPNVAIRGHNLNAETITSPVVFLNCCCTLRCGDSPVPPRYSLARQLWLRGSLVIGAYRNLEAFDEALVMFAQLISDGVRLGNLVNQLNREVLSLGGIEPPFQLLGLPTREVESGKKKVEITVPWSRPLNTGEIENVARGFSCVWRLFSTVGSWFELTAEANEVFQEFRGFARRLQSVTHVERFMILDASEVSDLLALSAKVLEMSRLTILHEVVNYIQTEGWINKAYASVSKKPQLLFSTGSEADFTSISVYHPTIDGLLPAYRQETDTGGTLSDWIGDQYIEGAITASASDVDIAVQIPPLPPHSIGRVFVHRAEQIGPSNWPAVGGSVSLSTAGQSVVARATVVAVAVSNRSIEFKYCNIFVDYE